jgi:hypothetical protein
MVSTLESFDRKLASLDEIVTPVYEATNETRLLMTNVDRSLLLTDSILKYYDIYTELATMISSGPVGNLVDYLAQIDRLVDAVKYFTGVTAVSESDRVIKLFNIGRQKLIDESDKLISRYANPLSSKDLIDLCQVSMQHNNETHAMQGELILFDI